MALHALEIVKEEFVDAQLRYDDDGRGVINQSSVNHKLALLEARIITRIAQECIEQPEPEPDRAGPRPGQEVWAVGLEHQPNEFGMIAGPYPTFKEALDFYAQETACIIHFFPGDPREDPVHEVTHRWDVKLDCWKPTAEWLGR